GDREPSRTRGCRVDEQASPSRRLERNRCRTLALHDARGQKRRFPSSIAKIAAENDVSPLIHLRTIEGKDRQLAAPRRICDGGEGGAGQVVGDLANRINFSSGQRERGI